MLLLIMRHNNFFMIICLHMVRGLETERENEKERDIKLHREHIIHGELQRAYIRHTLVVRDSNWSLYIILLDSACPAYCGLTSGPEFNYCFVRRPNETKGPKDNDLCVLRIV